MTHLLILGAGTAGTIMANRLHAHFRRRISAGDVGLTVVDQDDVHIYQPGLLFVPFGVYRPDEIVRPRRAQLPRGIEYVQAAVDRVEAGANQVILADGRVLPYDLLIVASGSRIAPDETEGLTGAGWRERTHEFYSLEGATALTGALERFEGGRLVVNIIEVPIKCPVAPLEFAFLADWYLTERGIRDRATITFVTPLDGAFTKPVAAAALSHLLATKRIELVTEFSAGSVDGERGRLVSWDEREVPFDLLVTIPLHRGAAFVGRSPGLGDDADFVRTDPYTLQARAAPNVFALGDATDLPASKAGSVAHFEAEVLTENVVSFLDGRPLAARFDGHANCFIETGHARALLIDFNYEIEPLPGAFPYAFGPMRLLKESRINHWAKMAFQWVYWHLLLPGKDVPGIPAAMGLAGKEMPAPEPRIPQQT
jgi:sulfide:quinone oxidoreductase